MRVTEMQLGEMELGTGPQEARSEMNIRERDLLAIILKMG
jgi:hypothetical protein